MKFSENHKLARAVLCLCIAGTILLGGGRDLRQYRETQAKTYYQGTDDSNGKSIYQDLQARCEAGYNLITVAKRYLPADSDEIAALADAVSEVEAADDPKDACAANYRLTIAADRLYAVLTAEKLTDADDKLAAGQFTEMTSRNQTIAHDGYNDTADEFNRLLKKFPTGLIAAVNGIRELELYQ